MVRRLSELIKLYIAKCVVFFILNPLSILWDFVYRWRRLAFRYGILSQNIFSVPIISIGNLTFGGTGKTPFTEWLANYFLQQNKKVMVVMRGYKGALENSRGKLKSKDRLGPTPFDYGDEAFLLSRRLPEVSVVVGKNRSANLDYYFKEELPDIVLLDDGHQHLKLARNLNIVLFDAMMSLGSYHTAPRGYLREGMFALQDADAVLVGRSDLVPKEKLDALWGIIKPKLRHDVVCGETIYRPAGLFNRHFQKLYEVDILKDKKIICVNAIASPASFYTMLESLGASIIARYSFPDHHYYSLHDLEEVFQLAIEKDAYIVTTEKDMVKIRRIAENDSIFYLGIQVEFSKGEEEFKKLLNSSCII